MGLMSLLFKRRASHLSLGEFGEKATVKEMKKMGMEILRVNYAVHKVGEIDIIARDGACLVFVEVKTRVNTDFSRPGEAVNAEKKKKLWKTSRAFIRELGNPKIRFRFDVAEVYFKNRFSYKVLYLSNAFNVDSVYPKRYRQNDF
ncbi:MAG: YraN family protein [Lentisphaeraceae bacterium]|nr:YraN family protein [Lentisphaeraceae bacterium]